ncbi:MAG: tetratricopeptide repeat protein [Hyphomicrobium sp.]
MTENKDALLREVDEELRREKLQKLWEKYGVYVLGLAIIVVASVGGYKFWSARQLSFAEAQGAQYEAALQLIKFTKTDDAKKELEKIISSGHLGYATLAKLQLAGIHLKSNRPKDALLVLEEIEKNSSVDPIIRTFATYEVASLRLAEADFPEMESRLKSLVDGASAWRIPARELLGTAAFKNGKYEEARKILLPLLSEPQLPPGIQERTQLLLSAINTAEVNKTAPSSESSKENSTIPSTSAPPAPNSDAK